MTEVAVRHKHLQFGQGFRVVLGDHHNQASRAGARGARIP